MSQCAYSFDANSWTDLPVGPRFDLSIGVDEQNTELITDGGVSWTERLFERDDWNLNFKITTAQISAFQALHDAVDGQLNRLFITLDRTADPIVAIYGWKEAGFALQGTGEPVQPPLFTYRLSISGETMSILALLRSYDFNDLPANPAAGTLVRVSDGLGGLWMYSGTQWVKQSSLINVKDAPFNAAGDGFTDDSAAIQAAIDAAFDDGGGMVYLPKSTYIISSATVKLKTNVGLCGDGPSSSILKLGDGANRHVLATLTDVDTYFGTGNVSVGEYGIQLRDFSIDGNKANNSSGRGLSCYWYKCEIRNVIINNCKARGIYEGWGSFGTPAPFEDMTNTYDNVTVTSCDGIDQWLHNGPHDSKFLGCIVCQGVGTSNIHVGPDGAGAMFVNCHSWSELGVRQPSWSVIFEGPFCMWSNSTAEGGSVGQLLLRANDPIISGGAQYSIDSAFPSIGIQIGDTANGFTNISGYDIRTITRNFSVATIAFDSDGGIGRIEINGFNTVASTVYTGTPAATSFIEILVTGFGGTLIQIPSPAVLGLGGLLQSIGGALSFLNLHGDANNFPLALAQFVASAVAPHLSFAKSRATAPGSHTTVQNGDGLGNMVFVGDDGTTYDSIAAGFGVIVDGTPATGKVPGTFVWSTTPQGATSALERMRLDSKGNLVVGPSVLATNATDGFVYVPTCAGTPTGTPSAYNGSPVVVDSINNRLYFYSNGSWRNAGP